MSNIHSRAISARRAAAYAATRADAQARADATGLDHGLEWNAVFGEYSSRMLPRRENRCGSELRCEVVHPTDLSRCQPGHGPGPVACGWHGGPR